MKKIVVVIVFIFSIFYSIVLQAQSQQPVVDPAAYKAAVEAELSASPREKYLYERADAYPRLVHIRAMKRLGYDITQMPEMLESNLPDTGLTSNISLTITDQDETTVSINHLNSQIIVVGANDDRMYNSGMPSFTSLDGGRSWKWYKIPKPKDSVLDITMPIGDPALASDDSGYFYYVYLAADQAFRNDNLIVATSKDGIKWVNGSFVIPPDNVDGFEDKEQIAVDCSPLSPHYGRVYLAWVHYDNAQTATGSTLLVWSDDHCKTWSDPSTVADSIVEFAEIKIASHGEIIFTYSTIDFVDATGTQVMLVSKDGGVTFTGNKFADFVNFPINNDGRPSLKGNYGFRSYPYTAEDIDLKTDQIHLVYSRYDDTNSAAALSYVTTKDFGNTWSEPRTVGLANPEHASLAVDRFMPWVSVNQKTGDAFAVYYSSENDEANNQLVNLYRAKLTGGMTEYPHVIGDRDFDPNDICQSVGVLLPFIGDYIGSDAYDTLYAATWTENKKKGAHDGEIYAYIGFPGQLKNSVRQPVVINSQHLWLSAPSPNPVETGIINFSYYLPQEAIVEIALYNSTGVKIKSFLSEKFQTGTYSKEYSINGIASGTYILRLSTQYGSAEKNLVVVR